MQRTLRETTGVGWNYLAMGRKNVSWGQSSLGGSAFISGGFFTPQAALPADTVD